MLFPSRNVAIRCVDFLRKQDQSLTVHQVKTVELLPDRQSHLFDDLQKLAIRLCAVVYPQESFAVAKMFWQHTGDGVSSRRAEFCHRAFEAGSLVEKSITESQTEQLRSKGPRRYQGRTSFDKASAEHTHKPLPTDEELGIKDTGDTDGLDCCQFIEERFGRNLDTSFVSSAKLAVRRRIAGSLVADVELSEAPNVTIQSTRELKVKDFSEDDVYLYPTGMSSIFNTHRTMLAARGPMKSICFGFPYIDTLKVLEKWGPGCLFYGQGSAKDLDDLEKRLRGGERYLALFCELPGNPLLKSPDLVRIRCLADQYDFAVIVDETVGNFLNVHVLPYADVVVSSLTKVFSGDSNVMGGSAVLNPTGRYYDTLKQTNRIEYEDCYWAEDVLFLERNSRDFVSRIGRINANAEAICRTLPSTVVKEVYYPKYSPTRRFYDQCRTPNGGYGGLLSVTFFTPAEAVAFFDRIEVAKGPSLGTNFTLWQAPVIFPAATASPYTLLAHYSELDWRKKARISNLGAAEKPHSVRRRNEDDLESRNASSDAGSTSEAELDEIHGGRSDDDAVDEDRDTQRATQVIARQNKRIMDNMPADNGIIESVTCINFMCHNKLHVPFGPLINFIIGHNGSGKSAVLTALTLCLGGKAASTNRGQSLKSFIKEGEESTTLIVKLKNTGHSGYQQETYGDSIIVERHFSKAGASSFRLKNENGRTISTRKADLEEICDYFALQIDNPMNVLTQDMARQFLSNSSPSDKYRFFVKGVQLEQLDQDYQLLEETIDNIEAKLEVRTQDVKLIEERARKAAAKQAMSEKHDTLRDRIRTYTRQMAWVQVEEQEKALVSLEQDVQAAGQRKQQAEETAAVAEQGYDQANTTVEQASQAAQELRDSLRPLQESKAQVKEKFDQNKAELLNLVAEQRSVGDHLKASEARIKKAHEDIALEHKRLENANGSSHTKRLEEVEQALAKVTDVKVTFDQNHEAMRNSEDRLRQMERDLEAAKAPVVAKQLEIKQCEGFLNSLMKDRGAQHGAFHANMPRLLRAIREETGFRTQPVGPIGSHVRLLKPVWSSILEKSFGGTLSSFIVTSKSDQSVLTNIMRRVNCVCPILIGNDQPINTSQHEPDQRFDTTLRVLEIDNELVKRQLIINQAIEQTILIESRSEAQTVMSDEHRPRNVRQCYCLNDQRRGWGIRYGWGRDNAPTASPMAPMTGQPRMKTDVESQISLRKETLHHLNGELRDLQRRVSEISDDVRSCNQTISRHVRQKDSLRQDMHRAEEHAERLQDELDQDRIEEGRLDALKEGLKDAMEEKSIGESSYGEAVTARDTLNVASRSLKEQLHEIDRELTSHASRIKKAEDKVLRCSSRRQTALQEKNSAFQAIRDAAEDQAKIDRRRQTQSKRVIEFSSQARKVSERVTVDRGETPNSLDKKLEKLSRDLERFQRDIGGSPEAVARHAVETRIAYQTAQKQVKELQDLAQNFKYSLIGRQDRWRKFQRFISARARAQFTYLLSERSFRGALKTDHKRRILDLHVEPDETKAGKGRQTKTLSGGEKSFSTICLLLSLWEAMGSPIRCLDEFDVFMDSVNRDVSLKMMIMAARRSPGRQFVLITPQSMGNVDVAGDVKIIKLSDPERGQTTLPFAR
ncbi:MAG: Structural maintenance of chromosomes protein 6 [Caeruleum heppii]|nr:MAG: Structural maintenance of chromosomes protein 6 [Caeruleum heppii]